MTPWANTGATRALMGHEPGAGTVASRRSMDNIGVTVVRFANGVEAWLKPTDFKNDQVLFTMYARGGASLSLPADFVEASLATSYIGLSGAGGKKALDLEKLLAGKLVSAEPFISLSTHGVSGSAPPADLETALQLLHQVVVAPGDGLQKYLGAWGHMLVASDDLIDMMHTHPFIADGSPEMQFSLVFPRPRMYRVWVQFQRNGIVNTAHFDVAVAPPPAHAASTN